MKNDNVKEFFEENDEELRSKMTRMLMKASIVLALFLIIVLKLICS